MDKEDAEWKRTVFTMEYYSATRKKEILHLYVESKKKAKVIERVEKWWSGAGERGWNREKLVKGSKLSATRWLRAEYLR